MARDPTFRRDLSYWVWKHQLTLAQAAEILLTNARTLESWHVGRRSPGQPDAIRMLMRLYDQQNEAVMERLPERPMGM